MIWVTGYILIGLVVLLVVVRRDEKRGVDSMSPFLLCPSVLIVPVTLLLWPMMLIIGSIDANIQIQERKEKRKRAIEQKNEQPEDLSRYVGLTGKAITPLAPHGLIRIENRQIQAVSDIGYLPSETNVRITGVAPFGELHVTTAEQARGRQPGLTRPDFR